MEGGDENQSSHLKEEVDFCFCELTTDGTSVTPPSMMSELTKKKKKNLNHEDNPLKTSFMYEVIKH